MRGPGGKGIGVWSSEGTVVRSPEGVELRSAPKHDFAQRRQEFRVVYIVYMLFAKIA